MTGIYCIVIMGMENPLPRSLLSIVASSRQEFLHGALNRGIEGYQVGFINWHPNCFLSETGHLVLWFPYEKHVFCFPACELLVIFTGKNRENPTETMWCRHAPGPLSFSSPTVHPPRTCHFLFFLRSEIWSHVPILKVQSKRWPFTQSSVSGCVHKKMTIPIHSHPSPSVPKQTTVAWLATQGWTSMDPWASAKSASLCSRIGPDIGTMRNRCVWYTVYIYVYENIN